MTDTPIGCTNLDCKSNEGCARYKNWNGDGEFEPMLGHDRCDWFIEKGK